MKMKENNHNTCIVYLLNCIDKHIHWFEMFLACLKINVKHPKNIDVETCRLQPVTPQCTKWLFPTAAMCLVQWNVWIHRLPRKNVSTMSPALVGRNFSSVDILLTFMLCQCNVMTLLNNVSGTGARWWTKYWSYIDELKPGFDDLLHRILLQITEKSLI